MRLYVDTSKVQFQVTKQAGPKVDQNGRQKTQRDTGEPMWTVQVMALDEQGGEMLNVTVAGVQPKLTVGQWVNLIGLEALPWNRENNGRHMHGVAFRAQEIKPTAASKAA